MSNPRGRRLHELLQQDLAELKLTQIAETYQEVLDEASRQNTSMLQVLATLIAAEVTSRRGRALDRRIRQAKLPPRKTLEGYDFTFPKRIPKQKVLRLLDCELSRNISAGSSLARQELVKATSSMHWDTSLVKKESPSVGHAPLT